MEASEQKSNSKQSRERAQQFPSPHGVNIRPQNEARDHSVGDGNIGCKMFCLILQALRLEVLSGSALLHPTRVQLFLLFYLIVITANADTTQLR
mmetsp:Transcript_56141/g.67358  ORF Transcript_56141/g.67358 Transcript_56141/m.67358 type:complete len:94 (+) Transcript_56141:350-631(+)